MRPASNSNGPAPTNPFHLGVLYCNNFDKGSEGGRHLFSRYVNGDGVIIGWGLCRDGELGTNARYNAIAPVMIGGHDKPVRMACSGLSSAWLGAHNMITTMGSGIWGELGVGNPRYCPRVVANETNMPICPSQIEVVPFTSDRDVMVDVVGGSSFFACVSLTGAVYAWGANNYAQCHPDLRNACCGYAQPRRISGERVVQVASASYSVIARTASGAVYGWGLATLLGADEAALAAELGKRGAGLVTVRETDRKAATEPVALAALADKRVVLVRGGPWHFAAVVDSGAVYTWGLGNNGRLGHGDEADHLTPTVVAALAGKRVVEVTCGSFHTVFVTADGAAYACGDNQGGQCGVLGEFSVPEPAAMKVTAGRPVIHAAAGRFHTALLLNTGEVVAYGSGVALGIGMGYGMRMVRCQPVMDNYTGLWIASGPSHCFALTIPKSTCMLVLGLPHRGVPAVVVSTGLKEGIMSCGAGAGFTIMVNRRGSCYAFGVGGWGQLGVDVNPVPAEPERVVFTKERIPVIPRATRVGFFSRTNITHVAAGYAFSMAVCEGERVYAWGSNSYAQCGLGCDPKKFPRIPQPKEIAWLADKQIVQVACGSYFALALSSTGEVFSWGALECCGHGMEPDEGAVPPHYIMRDLGDLKESRGVIMSPCRILSLKCIVQVAAGGWHAIALDSLGEMYVWGVGTGGRLGTGSTDFSYVPTKIEHPAFFTRIGCGCYTSYAIDDDAKLYLWGVNERNQLGSGSKVVMAPTLAMENVRDVALGKYFTVILTFSNTFHFSGTMEHDKGTYVSSSFDDTENLPDQLRASNVQTENYKGLRLFGGLEHVIVLVEKDAIPAPQIEECCAGIRKLPANVVVGSNTNGNTHYHHQRQGSAS